jgi:hypothetical protein
LSCSLFSSPSFLKCSHPSVHIVTFLGLPAMQVE